MQAMDSATSQINQLGERIRAAASDKTPLRICGGGSKDFYGLRLQGEPLSTRAQGFLGPCAIAPVCRGGGLSPHQMAVRAPPGFFAGIEPATPCG